MSVGIAAWSFMTMLCGLASQYWQLFLARMGVGVGEAALGAAQFRTCRLLLSCPTAHRRRHSRRGPVCGPGPPTLRAGRSSTI